MRWELKARARERGITTSAGMRRRLAALGLVISAGKMSGLWSGTPVMVRLQDLEVICAVLACEPSDLLVREPETAVAPIPRQPDRLLPAAGVVASKGLVGRPVPPL